MPHGHLIIAGIAAPPILSSSHRAKAAWGQRADDISVCWLWTRTAKHFCFCLTLDSVYMYPPTYCLSRVSPFGWKLSTGILIIAVILISSCCRNPSLFWMWLIFVCLHGHFNQVIYINLYLRCCASSMILASDDFQTLANTAAMAGGVMLSVCLSVYPTLIMKWI